MTACKDSLSGKKAVSATLAGVLAVGMVPAAAFAADDAQADTTGEQGVELQSVESAKAFSDGTVDGSLYQNGSATTSPSYNAKQPVTFKATTVTLKTGGSVDVSDTDVYEVAYYVQDKDGEPTGDAISAPVEAGKYCAVVTAKSGTYEGGAAVYKFTIAANEFGTLAAVALDEDGEATADSFVYTASEQPVGFTSTVSGTTTTLKEGKDYTVKFYKAGGDLTDAYAISGKPVDAGNYTAVITGAGNYAGTTAKQAVTVDKLVLSNGEAAIEDKPAVAATPIDTIETTSATAPTKPTAITVNGKKITDSALLDQIKLTLADTAISYDANGSYTFNAAAADKENKNITGSATATVNKVKENATFKYGKTAAPASLDVDASDGETFDQAKLTAWSADGKTKITDGVTYAYADKDGKTKNAQGQAYTAANVNAGGTWTVTVKVTPSYGDNNKDKTNYQVGGEQSMTVKVTNGAVDADASVYFTYGADVVTSVEATYSAKDLLSDAAKTIGVKVYAKADDTTALTAGTDYKVTVTDENGKDVTDEGIENAGTYTVSVTSETYDLSGATDLTVVVKPFDLTDIKAVGLAKSDGGYEYIAKPAAATATPGVQFNTGEKDSEGEAVYAGFDQIPGYNSSVKAKWQKLDAKTGEWKDVTTYKDEGDYRVNLKYIGSDENAANYIFLEDGETNKEYKVVDAAKFKFDDVTPDAWYFDEVGEAANAQYIYGVNNSTKQFAPNVAITRGDVAVILGRMAGVPTDPDSEGYESFLGGYTTPFSDVEAGAYYAKAIAWAAKTGIVTGYGDTGEFRPEQAITREEFATMLARYAEKVKGADISAPTDVLDGYADTADVSDWAKGYVAWAVEAKAMGQNTDFLSAGLNISRAEVAAMAVRYQPSK